MPIAESKPSDGGGNQAYEKRNQHEDVLRRTGIDCKRLQRDDRQ